MIMRILKNISLGIGAFIFMGFFGMYHIAKDIGKVLSYIVKGLMK